MLRRAVVLLSCVWISTLFSFGVNPAPILSSVSPATGSATGGTAVTLTGANFLSGAVVTFGSVAATNVVVVNSGKITATSPASPASSVDVMVVNPDGQTSAIMPLANPGFEAGATGWQFGGTGSHSVVTNAGQAHGGQNFAQLVSGVGNHPLVSGILASGNSLYLPVNPGDVITFGGWAARVAGDGTVDFVLQVTDGNKANPVYPTTAKVTSSAWTYYQTSYTIPSYGRFVKFYAEVFGNTVAATANFDDAVFVYGPKNTSFTFQGPPTIGWIGPNSGPANTANTVKITGTNFGAGSTVTFDGVNATNINVVNATTITAKTPASAAGTVNVIVKSAGGIASSPGVSYTFNPPPSAGSASPSNGALAGGTSVVISGSNFLPGAKVTFGGVAASNVFTTPGSITATTPAHGAGLVDVTVTNPDGQAATVAAAYTYQQPAPVVTSVSPASGSVKGGTIVILSGANFLPAPSVTFGGAAATVINSSGTAITVSAPAKASQGAVDVTVTNSDSQARTLAGGFDYVAAGPKPTVMSISSLSGSTAGGASVTINGSNFVAGATVTFDGIPATNLTVANSTISATTPPHPAGRVNVTVTNPDGQSATLRGILSLLPNPGFENDSTYWKFVGSGSGAVMNDPANAQEGNKYAVLSANAGGPATYYATDSSNNNQYFPVTPGDTINYGGGIYRLSGDGQTNFTLVITDSGKNVLTSVRTTPFNATNPVWANRNGTYTIPAGAAFVRLGAQIRNNTAAAQVRLDAVILERIPAGAGYTYTGSDSAGVFTYHYDNMRSGLNTNETTLTPSNVTQQTFGKKFAFPVDGWIDGQPLYVPNVTISGGLHNVVYVATEHDSVYAFDADGGQTAPLWQTSLINPDAGVTTIPTGDLVMGGFKQPEFGVMATPVIDPVAGTIYVLARTKENGRYLQRLHALDITTGEERPNSPVLVQASVHGTGTGSSNGVLSYNSYTQNVRTALTLANGTIYFAAASLEDLYDYHGWVLAYDAQNLNLVGTFCSSPDGSRNGIWQSGAGLGADAAGNVYLETGNGTFNANQGGRDYGDSFVKLQLSASGLNPVDYFTPYNQAVLAGQDLDMSSGASLLLPDQPGQHPHELIGGGKQGTVYVIDRDAMGGFNVGNDSQIVQAIPNALTPTSETADAGLWNVPMYWNHTVYFVGRNDVIKAFSFQNGKLNGPIFQGNVKLFVNESTISAKGVSNGILWVSQSDTNTIHAFDPYDLTHEYYNTNMAGTRDAPAQLTRFMVPTVVNGKVYVGTRSELDVYGLF